MAKLKAIFSCQACGSNFPKWQGKCTTCNEWDTIIEEIPATSSPLQRSVLSANSAEIVELNVPVKDTPRLNTGMDELNRVLGGGLVAGSAVLIGGDPGIGKSTLLLQTTAKLSDAHNVLYISGEESASQIQLRAKRLNLSTAPVKLVNTGSLETILATIKSEKPEIVIIDSIQTVYASNVDSAPGSVSQVRITAHELIRTAKSTGTIIIFVGHVTKDGNLAGPRILEHMVDAVMYFEGDSGQSFRMLRSFKNRFGSTGEIGVFEMTDKGLKEVANPSALFLSEREETATGSAVLAAINGSRPVLLEIQALVSGSNAAQPRRTALGIDHNRLSMISAVLDKHASFAFANHDIYLNVAGGLKITEPAADLAMAAALVSSLMNKTIAKNTLIFGEVGLSGEVRSVSHTESRLKEAEKLGYTSVICPKLNKSVNRGKLNITEISSVKQLASAIF